MKTKKQIARLEKIDRLVAEYGKLNEIGGSRTMMWQQLEEEFGWSRQHIMQLLKDAGVLQPKKMSNKKKKKKNERRIIA